MTPQVGAAVPVAVGDVLLGKYRVERILGRGGMGLVVAARHIDLDELFAIKLLLVGQSASAEAVERFLREARAAAKIKGEHVARTQDVGRLPDGTPYMVMEHLTGADLKSVVRSRGPLPAEECVAYVLQAAETLAEAHQLGIIHRDVKPANMFLTQRRNGSPCVKVLDFGISKQTGNDAVGLTMTSTLGGSPLYMSPEQMRSAKHVDLRTDIWSMGVVLYELLTGVTPFHADSITAVAGRVLQDEPIPPSQVRPGVPPALDMVVLRCLQKRPDDRFAGMEELIAALEGARSGRAPRPVHEDPPTLPLGQGTFPPVAQAISVGPTRSGPLAFAGGSGTTSHGLASTSTPVPQPPPGVPSRGVLLAITAAVLALVLAVAGLLVARALRAPDTGDAAAAPAAPAVSSPAASEPARAELPAASTPQPDPGASGEPAAPVVSPDAPAVASAPGPTAEVTASVSPGPSAAPGATGDGAPPRAPATKPPATVPGKKRRTID